MTINDLIQEGKNILGDRSTALLDCEVLLSFTLGVEKTYLFANPDFEVEKPLEKLFLGYVTRVSKGEPVAYVTKEKEFYGLNFYVDERVLVPRPETEQLVDRVLEYLRKSSGIGKKFKLIDVGTGSGNIPIAITKNFLNEQAEITQFDAVDIDDGAIEVAKINVQQSDLEDKIFVFKSDLLEEIEDDEKYDVIVANLPYIGEEKNRYVSADVEKHEPRVALFGGSTGIELYEKLFSQIREKNIDYAIILGEFGFAQGKDMERILNKFFEHNWRIEPDLAGIDRIFIIEK